MKRIISLFLAVAFLLGAVPLSGLAASGIKSSQEEDILRSASGDNEKVLRFDSNGKFKIMIFTDAHTDDNLAETTRLLMCEALDKYKPDFVVYLGDNTTVSGYDRQVAAIDALTKPVRDRGVAFGMVHGNHDSEYGLSRDEICEIWDSFGSMTYDADPALYGCGNCNLPIYASNGAGIAFNLWFIDSGSTNPDMERKTYDYVHPDQIEWYKRTALELKEQNGGKPVPAIDFQHIIIPEIYDDLYTELPFLPEKLSAKWGGKAYFTVPDLTRLNGYWLEHPCPPEVYDGQLDAWKEIGDVIAEFNGHDHKNSFRVNIHGIDVVNVPACGENAYHSDYTRGVGLITLDEKHPCDYSYELIQMYKLALDKDSKIPEADGQPGSYYKKIAFVDAVPQLFFKICLFFNRMGKKISSVISRMDADII